MLAAGFVCSSAVTKNIFDNDFLKNLCFTLHWQPPSAYVIQKKIAEISNRLSETTLEYLRQQSAVTLIVYPWVDINKRSSLSFVACTPSSQLVYLSHITSKADNWNQYFIVEQIQQAVSLLRSQNVNVSQLYLDDCFLFDQIKEVLVLDPQLSSFPLLGNTIEWCQDLLNTLFSFPLLMGIKQSVSPHFHFNSRR